MRTQWLIRAGRNGELADEFLQRQVMTVGWDVGDLDETDPGWEKTKEWIVDEHGPNDPGQVTGRVRSFVGVRDDPSKNIKPGDLVVIEGDASVVAVAEAGEYRYEESGLPGAPSHTYWRNIREVQEGPVKMRDLPPRFRTSGQNSVHLGSTLQRYKRGDAEAVRDLRSILAERE